jgi:hypothetical protein
MSWRTGSELFIETWKLVQKYIPEKEHRIQFTARLLSIFEANDMDTYDIEDVHPDIRAAMRLAGIELAEPERYADEETN